MKKYLLFIALIVGFNSFSQDNNDFAFGSNAAQGKIAEVNGIKMYYETYGEGEPVLLLHGGIGSIDGFTYLIPYLSEEFKVIAVDFRGHGRTNNNLDSLSYDLHAHDIADFISLMGLDKIRIVGFSDGGVVALKLALKIPEKIEKMVVVGANKSVSDLVDGVIGFSKSMISDENLSNPVIKNLEGKYLKLNPEPDKYKRFIQLAGHMWLREPYITDDDYKKIAVTTQFIYGDRDVIRFDNMIQMYKEFSHEKKQLCILPNTDHFVFQEKHSHVVNSIIRKYLKEK